MSGRLGEIVNRRPSRWSNLSIFEFERDIKDLQDAAKGVEELEAEKETLSMAHDNLQREIRGLEEKLKRYIKLHINYVDMYASATSKKNRYREAIEKAIEEEEQNLEGYESSVYKILTEALEESQ